MRYQVPIRTLWPGAQVQADTENIVSESVNLSKLQCAARLGAKTYCTARVDARPLHSDGDAIEEDDHQHNVVKQLVSDDLIAHEPKPGRKQRAKKS